MLYLHIVGKILWYLGGIRMKLDDKIIAVIGAIILIFAGIFIFMWAPKKEYEDDDLIKEEDLEFIFLIHDNDSIIKLTGDNETTEETRIITRPALYTLISARIQLLENKIDRWNRLLESCYEVEE